MISQPMKDRFAEFDNRCGICATWGLGALVRTRYNAERIREQVRAAGQAARPDKDATGMRAVKNRLVLAAFVCVLMAAPSATHGRVHVGVGIGIGYGPHYGWYDPWYCDPWCSPWHHHWYHYDPVFIGPPVVVERQIVVHEPPLPAPQPAPTLKPTLSEDQQQKRTDLLERLRIGDVNARAEAAQGLTRFAGDDKTREALEKAVRSDRDATVRKAAVEALAKQSGKKAVPALKQAYAEDTDRDVRQAAYKALIMIEGY